MRFRTNKKRTNGALGSLDLTPIVDVVFNLLIFFALSLNFAATSGGINVKLPSASSAESVKSENITINLTKDGKTYYNEEISSKEEIKKKLREITNKSSLIIIRADNLVEHGKVVEAMDLVKSEGFNRLAIAVDKAYLNNENQ